MKNPNFHFLKSADTQSHLSFGIRPRVKVRLLDLHSMVWISNRHENSEEDSHVKHAWYVSRVVVDVSMFFVLTRCVTKRKCKKFCIQQIFCVQILKNNSWFKCAMNKDRASTQPQKVTWYRLRGSVHGIMPFKRDCICWHYLGWQCCWKCVTHGSEDVKLACCQKSESVPSAPKTCIQRSWRLFPSKREE
jgi:hypothetical protein